VFVSLGVYSRVRERTGHFRGGRFDLCCGHSGGGDGREDEEGEGERNGKVSSRFARLMEYQHLDFGGKTLTSLNALSS
jgi:hypothetical protein